MKTIFLAFALFALPCFASAQTTAKEWQAKAVKTYADLGMEGSLLNKRFLEAYTERRKSDPAFFDNPKWPMILAEESAESINAKFRAAPSADRARLRDDDDPKVNQPWQSDWKAFVAEVQWLVDLSPQMSDPASVIKRIKDPLYDIRWPIFKGKEVIWTGRVKSTYLEKGLTNFKMTMPHDWIRFEGTWLRMEALEIRPNGPNVGKWENVRPGALVRFRTTLEGSSLQFILSMLQDLNGRRTLSYNSVCGTEDAELIEIIEEPK